MKKRNFFIPEPNLALFKTDSSDELNSDELLEKAAAGGSKGKLETDVDWIMIDKSQPAGKEVPKGEVVLDGKGPIKPKPINEDPEPRAAILMVPLAPPAIGGSFRLSFGDPADPAGGDTIEFSTLEGEYVAKRDEFDPASIILEVEGAFFTIFNELTAKFETYVNTNTPNEIVKTEYSREDTFDQFRCSFLVAPKVA